jgi:hypothetical protein
MRIIILASVLFLFLIPALFPNPTRIDGSNLTYLPLVMLSRPAYYVSPLGNDSNPGTYDLPWRTVTRAANNVGPGDRVYIRGGIYIETVKIYQSGTQELPIQFLAFPGETPILDGEYYLPSPGAGLLSIFGDWVEIYGIEVQNSNYYGIGLYGKHNTVDNVFVHHSYRTGVLISGDYGVVQNSRIWRNSIMNEYGVSSTWSSGLVAARDIEDGITEYAIIRGNVVWENWGQGISTHESDHTRIEENIISDSFTTNIYIHDATNILCQRNFAYTDLNSYVYPYGDHIGIMMGDERNDQPSDNITIINNISYANNWNYALFTGSNVINNIHIANNTFVNGITGGILLRGYHQNVNFKNNIVLQESILPLIVITLDPDVTFSNNLWSKMPPLSASGPGDIVGDPMLVEVGSPFMPDWFRLLDISPAIGHAISLPEVLVDYFGNWRDSTPDMGAVEYIP